MKQIYRLMAEEAARILLERLDLPSGQWKIQMTFDPVNGTVELHCTPKNLSCECEEPDNA